MKAIIIVKRWRPDQIQGKSEKEKAAFKEFLDDIIKIDPNQTHDSIKALFPSQLDSEGNLIYSPVDAMQTIAEEITDEEHEGKYNASFLNYSEDNDDDFLYNEGFSIYTEIDIPEDNLFPGKFVLAYPA